MDGQPTRAARGWMPGEWNRLGAFLRAPTLPPRASQSLGGTIKAIAPLLVLDMALMALVLGAIGLAAALGMKMPDHLLAGLELTPGIVAAIVLAAPIAEEAIFRGWVSGRPGHVVATLAMLAATVPMLLEAQPVFSALALGAGVLVAAIALFAFRKRDAMGWFARHFRWFFYASAVLFALVHLTNFAAAGANVAPMLPLVIPQFVLGLLLAYLRVYRGLWSSMLLHVLHNALFVGLMLIGSSGTAA